MRLLALLFISLFFISCDNSVYETHTKTREFTIVKLKQGGKRVHRGFYVEGIEKRIRYRDIKNGKYKVGDKVKLSYDSVVNKTKGTFVLEVPYRLKDE